MHALARRPGRFRGIAVAGAVLGVLVGLLGMHVLGLHGVQHEAAPVSPVAAHDHDHHDGSAGDAHGAVQAKAHLGESASPDCCDLGHGMDGLMLCLALLIAGGILGALVRRLRSAVEPSTALRALSLTPRRRTYARAGPPYLMAYSVIRC